MSICYQNKVFIKATLTNILCDVTIIKAYSVLMRCVHDMVETNATYFSHMTIAYVTIWYICCDNVIKINAYGEKNWRYTDGKD